MNNVRYQITNKELFNSILKDVNTDNLRADTDAVGNLYFVGALDVIFKKGGSHCYVGEVSPNDYQESHGFILIFKRLTNKHDKNTYMGRLRQFINTFFCS